MLFIIIHQTYELWFKQLLHEFEKIKKDFSAGDLFGAIHSFKRVRTIMKVLVAQIDILETMTPSSFSSFRDRLETASGFQSIQFREIEFVLGYKRASTVEVREAGFSGLGSSAKMASRAHGDRSFLRFPRNARREDSGRAEEPRPHQAERTERTDPAGNPKALQIFARMSRSCSN